MKIPRFNAEASLYNTRHAYHASAGTAGGQDLSAVLPQQSQTDCQNLCLLLFVACVAAAVYSTNPFAFAGCEIGLYACGTKCPSSTTSGGGEVSPPPPPGCSTKADCPRGQVCCDCTGTCTSGAQCYNICQRQGQRA